MVIKMTNKDENFYNYMGRFFGSRLVEKQMNDRMYDDDNKEWYLCIEEEKVKAFVSIHDEVIKNIYTTKEEYLEEVLKRIVKQKKIITFSIVTNKYIDTYEKCGFKIGNNKDYKNFTTIYIDRLPTPLLD